MIKAPSPPPGTQGLSPRELAKTFAQRAMAAAEQSKIRSGDVLGPAIEAIAAAPAIVVEVTEGVAKEAAAEIGAHAKAVAKEVADAKTTLADLERERVKQVAAANVEMRSNFGKIAVGMADLLREETKKIIDSDRLRRSYLGFGIACAAALLLGGGAFWSGVRSGEASARAAIVGDTATRLNDWAAASQNSQMLLEMAKSVSGPMQVFASLSLQQQTDLIRIAAYASRGPIDGEVVPFPCITTGPRHMINIAGRNAETCVVTLPPGTQASGTIFNDWLKGIVSRKIDARTPQDLAYWAHTAPPALP